MRAPSYQVEPFDPVEPFNPKPAVERRAELDDNETRSKELATQKIKQDLLDLNFSGLFLFQCAGFQNKCLQIQ